MRDFLAFRKMLTPIFIQAFFWASVILFVVAAINNFIHSSAVHGLQVLILGPILSRVLCEFLLIFFRINETLTELKNTVQEKS